MSNVLKGRKSYDSEATGDLIPFFNRNVSEYPTEIGSVNFNLVPIQQQKDIIINVARLNAQQEYSRIMALVEVLQKQANDIKRRLEISELVHAAEYKFKVIPNNSYWLAKNNKNSKTILMKLGPNEWSAGKPDYLQYIGQVKCLADYTWIELDNLGNPL